LQGPSSCSTLGAMLLCINIGNTNIALGVHSGTAWLSHWRLSTVGTRTSDEYEMLIRPFLERDGIPVESIEAMAIASVVPELVDTFTRLSESLLGKAPFFVHSGVETGLDISIDNKRELGADLVANAVAGYRVANGGESENAKRLAVSGRGGASGAIIIDFGTALTFTMVSADARILGVSIAPGLNGAIKALAGDTAQLPHVKLEAPERVIGTNTINSIQSGVIFGYVGLVESMIRRIRTEMNQNVRIVATGGLHQVIADLTDDFDHREPWLHLEGIREIHQLNLG
jgi:type III pantothenate kinase